jgi:hypothetical protein
MPLSERTAPCGRLRNALSPSEAGGGNPPRGASDFVSTAFLAPGGADEIVNAARLAPGGASDFESGEGVAKSNHCRKETSRRVPHPGALTTWSTLPGALRTALSDVNANFRTRFSRLFGQKVTPGPVRTAFFVQEGAWVGHTASTSRIGNVPRCSSPPAVRIRKRRPDGTPYL